MLRHFPQLYSPQHIPTPKLVVSLFLSYPTPFYYLIYIIIILFLFSFLPPFAISSAVYIIITFSHFFSLLLLITSSYYSYSLLILHIILFISHPFPISTTFPLLPRQPLNSLHTLCVKCIHESRIFAGLDSIPVHHPEAMSSE